MQQTLERLCRLLAIQTALLSAAVHLLWVLPRLSISLLTDPVADSRPYLFVPAALLLVGIAAALFRGYHYRRLSALGGGTLGSLLVGYLLWEAGGVFAALAADPLALVAKSAELIGVVAFAGLYYFHHPARLGLEPVDSEQPAGADEPAESTVAEDDTGTES